MSQNSVPWKERIEKSSGLGEQEKALAILEIVRQFAQSDRELVVPQDPEQVKPVIEWLLATGPSFPPGRTGTGASQGPPSLPGPVGIAAAQGGGVLAGGVGGNDRSSGDMLARRVPVASRHVAHLPIDKDNLELGRAAATVFDEKTLVTYRHDAHLAWEVGDEITAMVHDENGSRRRPLRCKMRGADDCLDVAVLEALEQNVLIAPDLDASLYPGQDYFLLGQSTQTQSDASSVSHGKMSATQPDAWRHIRGDNESGHGDSGGAVFALNSGKLIAVCVGNDANTKKAVFAPIMAVMQFIDSLG